MGSLRPRNSTRARKARPVKRRKLSSNTAARRPSDRSRPCVPPAIEIAIEEQRGLLETTLSLLYCLHSALRREIDDAGRTEAEAVEDASKEADLTHITEMLMVRLNAIHAGLDSTELEQAKVDPESVRFAERARELVTDEDEVAGHD